MSFKKITENVSNITLLADQPSLSATLLKKEFDKGNETIKIAFNDQVDDLNEVVENIASEYNNTLTYKVGDYCMYENKLYKCITEITTAESFDSNKWELTKLTTKPSNDIVKIIELEEDTQSVTFDNLDCVKDGGRYEIDIIGTVSANVDLCFTVNDYNNNEYYQSGYYYTCSGGSSNATLTGTTGYRPAKATFYYGMSFRTLSTTGNIVIDLDKNDNNSLYSLVANWSVQHTSLLSVVTSMSNGRLAPEINNLNKITIKTYTGSTTIKKGTRIILRAPLKK